jgi:hypothetical protein
VDYISDEFVLIYVRLDGATRGKWRIPDEKK